MEGLFADVGSVCVRGPAHHYGVSPTFIFPLLPHPDTHYLLKTLVIPGYCPTEMAGLIGGLVLIRPSYGHALDPSSPNEKVPELGRANINPSAPRSRGSEVR